jgi:predicted transcriptional regulator
VSCFRRWWQLTRSYRNNWKIILDILRSGSAEAVKKTHIMYRANLNGISFNKFFPALVEQGYVVEAGDPEGGTLYRTSEKGVALIKALSEVERRIPRKDGSERSIPLY